MHFRNRVLAATAVIVMAVFAVYGSTKEIGEKKVSDTPFLISDQKETIYFGYSDDSLTNYISSAAVAFGEQEDVHVIPVLMDDNNYLEAIHQTTLENEKQLPDAYMVANDFLEKAYLAGLAGEIKDTAQVCNEEHFPKTAIEAITYQEKQVAYPFYYETSVLIYNKDYLKQWVLQQAKQQENQELAEADTESADQEETDSEATEETEVDLTGQISEDGVPYTMEALLHIADTFDVPEGVEGIMEWDVSDILYNYWFVGNYLVVGGACGDDPSMIDINNPQTEECLEFYKSLHQFFSIETAEISYDSCIQDFIDGKIVFTMGNTQTVKTLEEAKESGDLKYEYGYAVLPQISSDLKSKNMSVTYAICVNEYSKEKELANGFAAYLTVDYADQLEDRAGKYAACNMLEEKSEAQKMFDQAYQESVSMPKLMEIGNLWLQLETMFAKIWNGENVLPLLEELTGQIESQLIMR